MIDPTPVYEMIARHAPDWLRPHFMQRALLALLLLSPMCSALGVQVVNFRMAFFSDAISHSAFAGVAVGLLLAIDTRLAMLGLALLVGLGIIAVGRRTSLSADTVIGVFFSAMVAFGLAMVSVLARHTPAVARQAQQFLFGNVLWIADRDLAWLTGLFVVLLVFQAASYNRLWYVGISPTLAGVHGVRVRAYQYVFAGLLSLVVIYCVWTVGVLLVTAMLVVPAAAGRNLARSAGGMFGWALGVSVTSAVAGLWASVSMNTGSGATIVLFACAGFAVSAVPALLRRQVVR